MSKEFKDYQSLLFYKAKVDLNASKGLLYLFENGNELDLEVIFFHLQQSVEKLLKALLTMHKIPYTKTHDIKQLITLLKEQTRHANAQESAAFEKQSLIINVDSSNLTDAKAKVFYKPLEKLSGDIYGVKKTSEHTAFIYIVDGMGKGIPASVTAVLSATFLNSHLKKLINQKRDYTDLKQIVTDYQNYIKDYLLEEECVSFTFIYIDFEKSTFKQASFGMYPTIIKDEEPMDVKEIKSNNPPFSKYLPLCNITDEIALPNKFSLFLFSDGLVETENFGMEELMYHLRLGQEDEEIDLFKKLISSEFIADDDVTLIHIFNSE